MPHPDNLPQEIEFDEQVEHFYDYLEDCYFNYPEVPISAYQDAIQKMLDGIERRRQ
jgi:hypothetical protein